jgi:hypothetical protein
MPRLSVDGDRPSITVALSNYCPILFVHCLEVYFSLFGNCGPSGCLFGSVCHATPILIMIRRNSSAYPLIGLVHEMVHSPFHFIPDNDKFFPPSFLLGSCTHPVNSVDWEVVRFAENNVAGSLTFSESIRSRPIPTLAHLPYPRQPQTGRSRFIRI